MWVLDRVKQRLKLIEFKSSFCIYTSFIIFFVSALIHANKLLQELNLAGRSARKKGNHSRRCLSLDRRASWWNSPVLNPTKKTVICNPLGTIHDYTVFPIASTTHFRPINFHQDDVTHNCVLEILAIVNQGLQIIQRCAALYQLNSTQWLLPRTPGNIRKRIA